MNKVTAARLAQSEKCRSAEREVVSSTPARPPTRFFKKLVSDASYDLKPCLSSDDRVIGRDDVKSLALSPSSLRINWKAA